MARVSSNESQIVLGFLINFNMLISLWTRTERPFLFKPSQAWFSLEPSSRDQVLIGDVVPLSLFKLRNMGDIFFELISEGCPHITDAVAAC